MLLESVRQLAGETAKMARIRIRIESNHAESISVDAEQIKQVLLNLVLNAVQSMPSGGEIALRSRQVDGSVLLEVTDQGVGVPQENLERIFDPFFTTRAGGTGLGLSIAYQIINRHGGHLSVRNNPDRGATFTIVLPVSEIEVAAGPLAKALA
jgi:signal transduction histidine kinase